MKYALSKRVNVRSGCVKQTRKERMKEENLFHLALCQNRYVGKKRIQTERSDENRLMIFFLVVNIRRKEIGLL